MAKKILTDRGLKAIKPAAPGRRDMHWDAALPSFGVRVTDRGAATFVIMRRLNGRLVRRAVSRPWRVPLPAGADLPFPLSAAREAARQALEDIERGVDPKAKRAAERQAAMARAQNSFGMVAEQFISEHVCKLRSAAEVTAAIRRELVPLWGAMPIAEISRADVAKMLRAAAKDRPYVAHHLLAYARKLFNWAIEATEFGIESSPCDRISGKSLIGARKPRQRVLSDDELARVWRAAAGESGLGLPFAPFVRMLLLTGQRLREVAKAKWAEFDFEKALWAIPADRMKGDAAHEVPLTAPAIALLRALPRNSGPYVFSTTGGDRPIAGFSKAKARLDVLSGVTGWRYHDLRRTMRTHLGGLPVPRDVAELVIAHAQPELDKIYDQHSYRDEKRRALDLWAARLLSIVDPPEREKIVRLAARG